MAILLNMSVIVYITEILWKLRENMHEYNKYCAWDYSVSSFFIVFFYSAWKCIFNGLINLIYLYIFAQFMTIPNLFAPIYKSRRVVYAHQGIFTILASEYKDLKRSIPNKCRENVIK